MWTWVGYTSVTQSTVMGSVHTIAVLSYGDSAQV